MGHPGLGTTTRDVARSCMVSAFASVWLRLCFALLAGAVACGPRPTTTRSAEPVAPPLDPAPTARALPSAPVAVSRMLGAADSHACAVLVDGTVRCWGRNSGGALGIGRVDGTESTPVQVWGIDRVRSIAVDRLRTCVVHEDGRVSCWGDRLVFQRDGQWFVGGSATPRPIAEISDAQAVVFGATEACVMRRGGTARCWGDSQGALAASAHARPEDPMYSPPLPPGTTALALGGGHACALDREGAVWCWGANRDGQLGTGDTRSRSKPTRVDGLAPARAIAAVDTFSCALSNDGALACWGGTRCPANGDCGLADFAVTRPRSIAVAADLRALALSIGGGLLLDAGGHAWSFHPTTALGAKTAPVRISGIAELEEVVVGFEACGRMRSGATQCWPRGAVVVTPRPVEFRAQAPELAAFRPCTRSFREPIDAAILRAVPGGAVASIKDLRVAPAPGTRRVVQGYRTQAHACAPCPKGALCKPCESFVVLASDPDAGAARTDRDLWLFTDDPEALRTGIRYRVAVDLCVGKAATGGGPHVEMRGFTPVDGG